MLSIPVTTGGKYNNPVTLGIEEYEGELQRVIQDLQQLQEDYGHLGTLMLRLEYVPYSDGEEQQYELYVRREETDEEYKERTLREKKAQEKRIAIEKKHLADLLKKHGLPGQ